MTKWIFLLLLTPIAFSATARELVQQSILAMGGLAKLEAIRTSDFEIVGHTNYVEQSERPEGPYIVEYNTMREYRDFARRIFVKTNAARDILGSRPAATSLYRDGVVVQTTARGAVPGRPEFIQEAEDALDFAPNRVLLNALTSPDLASGKDAEIFGVVHHVIEFSTHGRKARVFLKSDTSLPAVIEWTGADPYSTFWGVWGDVTTRIVYSFWTQSGGIAYPLQSDVWRGGLPWESRTITSAKWNTESNDLPSITDELKKAFETAKQQTIQDVPLRPTPAPQEHAPGIIQLFNSWNSTIVKQDDGIVILETPISSGYSARVIAEAARRFPGIPIRAAITTSDAWPHLGGLREYVAKKIPLYIVDRNRPIVEKLIAAQFRTNPDSLQRAPAHADLRSVSTRTVVGAGKNRIELYPYRTSTGERMMAAYFPEHHLLYASDLVQPRGGTFSFPQYLREVATMVQREKLEVSTVFAMHAGAIPWSRIESEVKKLDSN